jgi:hypothetical protein
MVLSAVLGLLSEGGLNGQPCDHQASLLPTAVLLDLTPCRQLLRQQPKGHGEGGESAECGDPIGHRPPFSLGEGQEGGHDQPLLATVSCPPPG